MATSGLSTLIKAVLFLQDHRVMIDDKALVGSQGLNSFTLCCCCAQGPDGWKDLERHHRVYH